MDSVLNIGFSSLAQNLGMNTAMNIGQQFLKEGTKEAMIQTTKTGLIEAGKQVTKQAVMQTTKTGLIEVSKRATVETGKSLIANTAKQTGAAVTKNVLGQASKAALGGAIGTVTGVAEIAFSENRARSFWQVLPTVGISLIPGIGIPAAIGLSVVSRMISTTIYDSINAPAPTLAPVETPIPKSQIQAQPPPSSTRSSDVSGISSGEDQSDASSWITTILSFLVCFIGGMIILGGMILQFLWFLVIWILRRMKPAVLRCLSSLASKVTSNWRQIIIVLFLFLFLYYSFNRIF